MTVDLQGGLDGQGLKIGIVAARFNHVVTSRLLDGAKFALSQHGVGDDDVTVAHVPGSFDIPLFAKKMADSGKVNAVVCLGAVIRGDTDHHVHVSQIAAQGVWRAAMESGVPVVFGVLTTDTVEQALDRSGGDDGKYAHVPRAQSKTELTEGRNRLEQGNSGYNAGVAAVELANLARQIESL